MRLSRCGIILVAGLLCLSAIGAKPAGQERPEVNLLAVGDTAGDTPERASVTAALTRYVSDSGEHFNAAVMLGDNLTMTLHGANDPIFSRLFEQAYDPAKLNFPFYMAFGNHDYERSKGPIELAYAAQHPMSRWKMPSNYYRVDLPADHPMVTMLVLDSDRQALDDSQWQAEIEWLSKELDKPHAAWLVCCGHHPFFSNGAHGDNGVLQTQWGPIFRSHHVDFYMSGHDHTMQHLEIPGWPISFVVSGGGGGGRRQMLRDNRGPFSRSTLGFAHFEFGQDIATVKLLDGQGQLMHEFTRTHDGQVHVIENTPSDKATTHPLRTIVGLPDWGPKPATRPTVSK